MVMVASHCNIIWHEVHVIMLNPPVDTAHPIARDECTQIYIGQCVTGVFEIGDTRRIPESLRMGLHLPKDSFNFQMLGDSIEAANDVIDGPSNC